MRIRLTVARAGAECGAAAVVVTAPVGTVLAAVTGALVTQTAAGGGQEAAEGPVAVFAGTQRLDPHRHVLGEPPLLDGAALSLAGPGPVPPTAVCTASALAAYGAAQARLHVVAGPDAGGVHLLQGGRVHLGRSAEADVPLDDPDVSRLHCAVAVTDGGAVTVADLGSTNGTSLDGSRVGSEPVPLPPGSTLRLGETTVRLLASPNTADTPDTDGRLPGSPEAVPDGRGRLRITRRTAATPAAGSPVDRSQQAHRTTAGAAHTPPAQTPDAAAARQSRKSTPASQAPQHPGEAGSVGDTPHGTQPPPAGTAFGTGRWAPDSQPYTGSPFPGDGTTHGAGFAQPSAGLYGPPPQAGERQSGNPPAGADSSGAGAHAGGAGTPRPRGRGLGAWARRFTGGRAAPEAEVSAGQGALPPVPEHAPDPPAPHGASGAGLPDPSAVLLTALGPGPRLWERGPAHPDALTVRLGTAHRGGAPGGPVTVGLRETGSLGLAGPRSRLAGLARSVIAQLAALHGPATLEIVLLCADRSRDTAARTEEWSWLGWLPHTVPAHGQDCRLLTAYDREQAAARTGELIRRLDAPHTPHQPDAGPFTLLIVDGDPGPAALRDAVGRLTVEGPAAGVHTLCLAETPAASPASPLAATLEAAHAASPTFSVCGAAALLSGAVATAVRLIGSPGSAELSANPGPIGTVDAVSAAWAERFARALAPLRESEDPPTTARPPAVALPSSSRLLDELGLARATPAALLARWSEQEDAAGQARLVFGAGPRGPLEAELTAGHGHALITGAQGTGRTELLLSLAASLAAGERPDRLGLLLLDGLSDPSRAGLRLCTGLPHCTGQLAAGDPARMREFAQSLSAELKRRAELLGESRSFEEYARATARPGAERVISPRSSPAEETTEVESDSSGSTLRLRTRSGSGARGGAEHPGAPVGGQQPAEPELPPLPRLVVLVDDFEALTNPALGNPGRPAAGSVVRALDAVAREGARLGVHLVAATSRADSTAETELARCAALRVELTGSAEDGTAAGCPPRGTDGADGAAGSGGGELLPGRGTLRSGAGAPVAFQAGRVTGRIPRTATLRPTVVPLDWARAGDPPTRRPVRELGNGPTDLALLASAVERAAQSLGGSGGGHTGQPSSRQGALDG